jgi:hypothetical protein
MFLALDHRIIGFIICAAIIMISTIIILIRYKKKR